MAFSGLRYQFSDDINIPSCIHFLGKVKVKKRVRHIRRRICFHVPQRIYIKIGNDFFFLVFN